MASPDNCWATSGTTTTRTYTQDTTPDKADPSLASNSAGLDELDGFPLELQQQILLEVDLRSQSTTVVVPDLFF
jgi:hypothetical protein